MLHRVLGRILTAETPAINEDLLSSLFWVIDIH